MDRGDFIAARKLLRDDVSFRGPMVRSIAPTH
jgi:hypothetical protein